MYNLIIVDDDETLLEGMSTAVDWEKLGFTVCATATDGKEALSTIQSRPCDVLLTDIRMGRMDGLALVEALRAENRQISVVMMSAYEDFSYAQKAVRLGVEDYLLKPINLEQLYQVMQRVNDKLTAERSQAQKFQILNQRFNELGQKDSAEHQRASSTLNFALLEHVTKVTLLGNAEEAERYLDSLKRHLQEAGDNARVHAISAINSLSGQLDASGKLTDTQRKALSDARERAIASKSIEEAIESMDKCLKSIANEIALQTGDISGLMARAKVYVDKHYGNSELRIRDVASYVGLSTNYFSSMFAKYVGESFSDYLIRKRMQEAQLLLTNTELRNYEVAERVGYETAAYFSVAFKRFSGMSVSEYKKKLQNDPKPKSDENNKL